MFFSKLINYFEIRIVGEFNVLLLFPALSTIYMEKLAFSMLLFWFNKIIFSIFTFKFPCIVSVLFSGARGSTSSKPRAVSMRMAV